ncbi:hypothetical protein [Saccharibacillus alkalitolerans]|uniref:Lipoprotein n=1 Tax=Saccharibacillus alkalitolerans TaxID=2705290 RepID=A0ABX0F303_9BACL|nr:hypothetical protein [Saccharibacillus alkalitolerans]NGZ74972.1 hypothetical protein [Saccharibacillus alkalitolerans]
MKFTAATISKTLSALLALGLAVSSAGCTPAPDRAGGGSAQEIPAADSAPAANAKQPPVDAKPVIDYEAPDIDPARVIRHKPTKPVPAAPYGSPQHWEYADTHSHPYEGILVDYKLEGDTLVSLDFKPTVAILTSTNPLDMISLDKDRMNRTTTFPVRRDLDEPGTLTSEQLKHLVKGAPYTIYLDLWAAGKESFFATEVPGIYYADGSGYRSLQDDSPFDVCTGEYNECTRLTE